jgi:hypothetical protein
MTTQNTKSTRRQELPEEVVDRLAGLLPREELEEALEGLEPEQITGPGGLLTQLAGRVIETALGVLAVGLGAPLLAPQRARLNRLGEMWGDAHLDQRLTDEQPARARLDRDMHLLPGEPARPLANSLRRGPQAATLHLARHPVESVEGDLRSMHIEPGYDRHKGPPLAPAIATSRESLALSGGGPGSCHLCATRRRLDRLIAAPALDDEQERGVRLLLLDERSSLGALSDRRSLRPPRAWAVPAGVR